MEYANWPIRSRQNIHCGNVDRKRTRGASRWRDATLSSHCQLQCRHWLSHFAGNNFCPRHWEKRIDFDLWKWCPSLRLGQKSYPKEQTQRREMYYFLNCTPLRHSSLSFHGREMYHIVQGCDGTHHVEHKKCRTRQDKCSIRLCSLSVPLSFNSISHGNRERWQRFSEVDISVEITLFSHKHALAF